MRQPKPKLPAVPAGTTEHKPEAAAPVAKAALADNGVPVRDKPALRPASPLQAKAAATAAQEQEPFPATVIRERGQHLLGVHARGKAFALQMQLKAAEAAVRKPALLPASGQAPA